jgi:uncharacterized protein involved in response to NO
MLNIEEPVAGKTAFLKLGFRPFFTAALLFGGVAILLWMGMYFTGWTLPAPSYSAVSWHAHEMVYGFGLAILGGFLLTAAMNWTGVQTIHGWPLLILFLLWLLARVLPFMLGEAGLWLLAVVDIVFNVLLAAAVMHPVAKSRQWKHVGFPLQIGGMAIANIVFYAGLLGGWPQALHLGLYAGFYLVLSLIFTMGRRVIPFFIEKGLGCPFSAKNYHWLDVSSLVLFGLFVISDLYNASSLATAVLAAVLVVLHSIRLVGWYHSGIWQKTLLWTLYLGYAWIVFGFLLKVLTYLFGVSPYLAIHSFAYGGIGLITIGMMARVTLGHTGRSVFDPPAYLLPIFALLLGGGIVRVILPLLNSANYGLWIGLSQLLWAAAFLGLSIFYVPMLIKVRIDGRPG